MRAATLPVVDDPPFHTQSLAFARRFAPRGLLRVPPSATTVVAPLARRRSSDARIAPARPAPAHPSPPVRPTALPPKQGETLLKVTTRKVRQRFFRFRLDAVAGEMTWASKKSNRVTLASLVSVRAGAAAAADREALSISSAHEPRWITVSYRAFARPGDPPADKQLHLIALSDESFACWRRALQLLLLAKHALLGPTPAPPLTAPTSLSPPALLRLPKSAAPPHAALLAPPPAPGERLDLPATVRLCRQLGIHAAQSTLAAHFAAADTHSAGTLDFTQFQVFVRFLTHRPEVNAIYGAWSIPEGPGMGRQEFGRFLAQEQKMVLDEDALSKLFRRYADPETGLLTLDGFTNFLLSADNCAIADRYAPWALPSIQAQSHMDAQRLSAHTPEALLALSAPEPPKRAVHADACAHDMDRPLNEYFIAASHNTYLVSGQLVGGSDVEGLVRALQAGARSIEIDTWDGQYGEPMVTHGRTLTTRLGIREALRAVARYAFAASPWPLILCLEVHNTLPQQDVLASILRAELGPALLTQRLAYSAHAPHLPSPQELRGRILIKAKNVEAGPLVVQPPASPSPSPAPSLPLSPPSSATSLGDDLTGAPLAPVRSSLSEGCSVSDDASASDDSLRRLGRRLRSPKRALSPRLAELLVYTIGVKFRGFTPAPPEQMISFSESGGRKHLTELLTHARTHLVRIYPSLMSNVARGRHTSANPDPLAFWMAGCQQVALNWQTNDLGLELSHALFARNAAAGFVLKPRALREPCESAAKVRIRLTVRVVSAQLLPRADDEDAHPLSPSVSLALHTPPQWGEQRPLSPPAARLPKLMRRDPGMGMGIGLGAGAGATAGAAGTGGDGEKESTSVVHCNGFNPRWDEYLSLSLDVPMAPGPALNGDRDNIRTLTGGLLDLAFVRFQIWSHTSDEDNSAGTSAGIATSASPSIAAGAGAPPRRPPLHTHKLLSPLRRRSFPFQEDGSDGTGSGRGRRKLAAAHMASIGSLAEGFHHLPLYDAYLNPLPHATLFVHLAFHLDGVQGACTPFPCSFPWSSSNSTSSPTPDRILIPTPIHIPTPSLSPTPIPTDPDTQTPSATDDSLSSPAPSTRSSWDGWRHQSDSRSPSAASR